MEFGPIGDETLEFEVFSEACGYKKFRASSQDTILRVVEEGQST